MAGKSGLWQRVRRRWREEPIDRRLDDEIQFHLDQQTAKNVRLGMTPREARRAAFVRFGSLEPLKEETRGELRLALVREFCRDVRIALRTFRRAPGFAIATILTIGLGVGAATAVFSVVSAVLLRPLPYPQADHLVRLYQQSDVGRRTNVSHPNFRDWEALTHSFSAMAETASWGSVPVIGGSEPTMARLMLVSREFFDVMRVYPALGRAFTADEQHLNGRPAVVVSRAFWAHWLGAAASVEDRALRIGDRDYAVVGVMPEGFDYPDATAIWMPQDLNSSGDARENRTAQNYDVVGRVRDEATVQTAQADLSAVSRELKARYGDQTLMADAIAVPLLDELTASARPAIQMLFGAALLLLLIANTNVSSLLLARGAARRHEFSVQLAIGAGRARLARQFVAEAAVLCATGGIVGVITAVEATRALITVGLRAAPRLDQATIDWRTCVFSVTATVLSATALGLLMTVGARDIQLWSALSESRRSGTTGAHGVSTRHILVAVQIAVTLVLLAGAGMLGRSFLNLLAVNPGFRVDGATVLDLTLTNGGSDYRTAKVRFLDALLAGLEVLPGVTHVGLTTGFPLGEGHYSSGRFLEMTSISELRTQADIARLPPAAINQRSGQAAYRVVNGGYFQTLGIPLIRGRVFGDSDSLMAPHVAVISQSLADTKWPSQDPIGRFIQFGNMDGDLQGFRVIGVVGDVRERTMEKPPSPTFYVSYRQRPNSIWAISVILHGSDAAIVVPEARQLIRALNPELPIQARTVESAFDAVVAGRRFSMGLIAVFGVSALLLAMLGLYGLISYVVAQRTREIGIRMALGATSSDLIRLLVGRGIVLAVCGSAAGVVISLILSHLVRGLFFGVSPTDPLVLSGVALVTVGASIAASYVPAWRASRGEPVHSLRG